MWWSQRPRPSVRGPFRPPTFGRAPAHRPVVLRRSVRRAGTASVGRCRALCRARCGQGQPRLARHLSSPRPHERRRLHRPGRMGTARLRSRRRDLRATHRPLLLQKDLGDSRHQRHPRLGAGRRGHHVAPPSDVNAPHPTTRRRQPRPGRPPWLLYRRDLRRDRRARPRTRRRRLGRRAGLVTALTPWLDSETPTASSGDRGR